MSEKLPHHSIDHCFDLRLAFPIVFACRFESREQLPLCLAIRETGLHRRDLPETLDEYSFIIGRDHFAFSFCFFFACC